MPTPLEKALAHLDTLETDRQAALALSEQKTEEAKLIKARQEGFRAAMKILVGGFSVATAEHDPEEPVRRRARRRIPELITRELSFSGQAMTARQIAKAIDYNLERTESALTRMAESGQVQQSGKDRWEIAVATTAQPGVHAVTGGNGAHAPAA
jgi:hypothetical protein